MLQSHFHVIASCGVHLPASVLSYTLMFPIQEDLMCYAALPAYRLESVLLDMDYTVYNE